MIITWVHSINTKGRVSCLSQLCYSLVSSFPLSPSVLIAGTTQMHSDTVEPNTGNVPHCSPAREKTLRDCVSRTVRWCCGFSPAYLQVVQAQRVSGSRQVGPHTLPKVTLAGRVGVAARLWAWWGVEQEAAGTGGVLARVPAARLLQRRRPTKRQSVLKMNRKWRCHEQL